MTLNGSAKNLFRLPSQELVPEIKRKFESWARYTQSNGLQRKIIASYNAYYGNYFDSKYPGLKNGGEQGEFALLAVNDLRNIIQHIYNNVTKDRVSFDSLSLNADVESMNATKMCNSILEYYFYEDKLINPCLATIEKALYCGTAYLFTGYDAKKELYGMDGDGQAVYEGALDFTSLSIFDVILDPTKEDFRKQDWVCVRTVANRWNLIAEYPQLEEELTRVPKIAELQHFMPFWQDDEDNIWLYSVYHKKTTNIPEGRFLQFCDNDVVLEEKPNPYPFLPIIECKPFNRAGGAYGHSVAFDLLPIQETNNLLNSTIVSNQRAFGVQNVIIPKESGIQKAEVAGALNIMEVNTDDQGRMMKPEVLQLCSTPTEIFKYIADGITSMERISGVNSAARGQPPASLTSGTAIALVATASNEFNSSVQNCWNSMLEEAALNLVCLVQKFVKTEQLLPIVGSSNTSNATSFSGQDILAVKRVRIQIGNPLSKTLAGRVEIANNLLQGGLIQPPDYMSVLQTGRLTTVLDAKSAQDSYIQEENEMLAKGQPIQMLATDNHQKHLTDHLLLTFRTDVRNNASILPGVLNHIQSHIDQMETMSQQNPTLLSLALGLPLQLPQPQFPGGQPGMPGPQGAASAGAVDANPSKPGGAPPPGSPDTGGRDKDTAQVAQGPDGAAKIANAAARHAGVAQIAGK